MPLPLTHHSTSLFHYHSRTTIYTRPGTLPPPPHMRTNRTCNLVLALLLIGARLALSPTRRIAALHTAMAMAMAMVVTDDDVGLVRTWRFVTAACKCTDRGPRTPLAVAVLWTHRPTPAPAHSEQHHSQQHHNNAKLAISVTVIAATSSIVLVVT